MAKQAPQGRFRALDGDGNPLSGGKLYTYEAGTTTPKDTYTDSSEDTANANPVILDSDGYADVWLGTGAYKFTLTDSDDAAIWTVDNISGDVSAAFAGTKYNVSTNTNITVAYLNSIVFCTGSPTLSLLTAASATNGFYLTVKNNGSGTVTIDPSGSETIDSASTLDLAPGESAVIRSNGTSWDTIFKNIFSEDADLNFSGTNQFTGTLRFPVESELTISGGSITMTGITHTVDTESDAASDDLESISGGSDGQLLILSPANSARSINIVGPIYNLAYDAQSANFTVGQIVTGGTSGATGVIMLDTDSGTTGTLKIKNVVGTFQDNETITDPLGGSATSNIPSGVVTANNILLPNSQDIELSGTDAKIILQKVDAISAWVPLTNTLGKATTEEAEAATDDSKYLTPETALALLLANLPSQGASSIQVFESSGTWNKPAGVTNIKVTVVGAGGAGGDISSAAGTLVGAGGGGGGAAIKFIDVTSISSETVTIGAGGSGSGGTTSFGSHCSATGGSAGGDSGTSVTPAIPGAGGVGSDGDYNFTGDSGGNHAIGSNPAASSGEGGGSYFGGGARPINLTNHGNSGEAYGGGGSGAAGGSSLARNGGSGADGVVIVEEFK